MEDDSNITVINVPSTGTIWLDTSTMTTNVYTDNNDWISIVNPYSEISITSVVFEDYMPSHRDVNDMCKEYPALEKAYENFKTVYKMVEQDWIGKQKSDQQSLF
jgi:hypothetical protein